MVQPRRMLISSFNLTNGSIITPLLLFCLQLGLVCKKIHRFDQYTPRKCLDTFVQSAVDARRQGDENPDSSVVAETMKLLANSSYGYQIMDCSRHTVTKYLTDEKNHIANNSKMFKRLNHITEQLSATRNMIRESRVSSKKNLDVQKCCVSVAKDIVVMISVLTSTSLAAKVSIKEHWKSVAMVVQWQNIAKS